MTRDVPRYDAQPIRVRPESVRTQRVDERLAALRAQVGPPRRAVAHRVADPDPDRPAWAFDDPVWGVSWADPVDEAGLDGADLDGAPSPASPPGVEAPARRGAGAPPGGGGIAAWLARGPAARLERRHVPVLVALALLGIAVALVTVLRAQSAEVALPVTPSAPTESVGMGSAPGAAPTSGPPSGASGAGATPSAGASSGASPLLVHVAGRARRPGVLSLEPGARVGDAIRRAGGAKGGTGRLNLAQPLADGDQVYLDGEASAVNPRADAGSPGAAGSGGSPQPGEATRSGGAQVNLNSAGQAELENLPGVGPVLAQKILAWRQTNGRFSSVDELQEIEGVGPKTFARLAPLVRV